VLVERVGKVGCGGVEGLVVGWVRIVVGLAKG